jgi:hypothetical protein
MKGIIEVGKNKASLLVTLTTISLSHHCPHHLTSFSLEIILQETLDFYEWFCGNHPKLRWKTTRSREGLG